MAGGFVQPTGAAGCVSDVGAFDMVGNLYEWVADWVPRATMCLPALFATSPATNCLGGADTATGPGALLRGGSASTGVNAGVFGVDGSFLPTFTRTDGGFRAAR